MKSIVFKANIVLSYIPRAEKHKDLISEDIIELFKSGNIGLKNISWNWLGIEFSPTIEIEEVNNEQGREA